MTATKECYPCVSQWVYDVVLHLFRPPLIATLLLHFVASPIYFHCAALFPYDDALFYVAASIIVHLIVYVGLNLCFIVFYKFKLFQKYQLPRTSRMMPSRTLIYATIYRAFGSQFIRGPFCLFIAYYFILDGRISSRHDPFPSLTHTFLNFVMCQISNEILFYIAHRVLHAYPILYRLIHKQHHQYIGTIPIAAEYAHIFEELLSNLIPTMFWCIFAACHPAIWLFWLAWRIEETLEAHSGFDFSSSYLGRVGLLNGHRARFHDYHHTVNIGNFGSSYILDWLFGTMDKFAVAEYTLTM